MSDTYVYCSAITGSGARCTREVAYQGADLCTQHGVRLPSRKGWWGMACWNGLSSVQQSRLMTVGNLGWGYTPDGECPNGAEVEVTTVWDVAPGPRFYCRTCAITYLRLSAPEVPDVDAG